MRNGSARLNEEGMKPRCLHELEQYSTPKLEEIALEMQSMLGNTASLVNKMGGRDVSQDEAGCGNLKHCHSPTLASLYYCTKEEDL